MRGELKGTTTTSSTAASKWVCQIDGNTTKGGATDGCGERCSFGLVCGPRKGKDDDVGLAVAGVRGRDGVVGKGESGLRGEEEDEKTDAGEKPTSFAAS